MLQDLSILKNKVVSDFQSNYKNEEMALPQSFKNDISLIGKDSIRYLESTAVVTTPKGLNIYFPNQWFYIASFFTQYYVELIKYKQTVYSIFPDFDKVKAEQFQKQSWYNVSLPKNSLSDQEQIFLKKFLSDDYRWWNGAKTIDRGDFYVSPILNMANVVNASQSYIADLCVFLSQKPDAVKKLIDYYNSKGLKGNVSYKTFEFSLQQIFYGAPGTGKSHKVKEVTETLPKSDVFRTTFHPDSDYSTFVGCYKPKMVKAPIRDSSGHEIISACEDEKKRIAYEYEPQAFLKAYVRAYETNEPVFLVIEEINRGNCAQIFGDIFQLLDRNEKGYSEYPIDIDEDLKNYLVQQLGADSEGIKDGKLCLPPNLNLLATMNTSDQSLFPMDSAFKRRWDWEYVSIRYEKTKEEKDKNDPKDNFDTFTITIGDKDKGNVCTYLWTDFLQKVNAKILFVTDSEDKQMGEYFIKKSVDEKTFINKVMYYLWSEVGKDMYNTTNALFTLPEDYKDKDGKAQNQFSFNELFKENATDLLQGFMKKLEVPEVKIEETEASEE